MFFYAEIDHERCNHAGKHVFSGSNQDDKGQDGSDFISIHKGKERFAEKWVALAMQSLFNFFSLDAYDDESADQKHADQPSQVDLVQKAREQHKALREDCLIVKAQGDHGEGCGAGKSEQSAGCWFRQQ